MSRVAVAGRRPARSPRKPERPKRGTRIEVIPTGRSTYLDESERPSTSLLLVMPFVVVYQLYAAGAILPSGPGAVLSTSHITAFLLIEELFRLMGVVGRHLPALALVAMLLAAHILRRDRWRFHPGTLFAMAIESIAWAVPLLVLGWIMARYLPLAIGGDSGRWAILCFGAGIYEEMVFRLILVTALSLILKDLIGLRTRSATVAILLASGLLFAMYHYLSPGEDFRLRTFVFRTLAGGYFGALFLLRGFGITALCHSTYDLVVVGLLTHG